MPSEEMWKSYLDTLLDIRNYLEKSEDLEKQMAMQERAKIDKPPIARETPDPITGGPAAPNKPGTGVAKSYIDIPEATDRKTKEIDSSGSTMLKAEEDKKKAAPDKDTDAESSESDSDSDTTEETDENEELKSILKDIHAALLNQTAVVKSEIKKALPEAMKTEVPKYIEKMLRKQGFTSTHPDVTRLSGLDTVSEVKKSEDEKVEGDIKKSEDELTDAVTKLTNLSWQKLGQLREQNGLFRPF
jgi:hypothetical protein